MSGYENISKIQRKDQIYKKAFRTMAAPAVCLASCVAASEYLMVLLLLCKIFCDLELA